MARRAGSKVHSYLAPASSFRRCARVDQGSCLEIYPWVGPREISGALVSRLLINPFTKMCQEAGMIDGMMRKLCRLKAILIIMYSHLGLQHAELYRIRPSDDDLI